MQNKKEIGESLNKKNNYTYDELFKACGVLNDKEKKLLFECFYSNNLLDIMNDEILFKQYCIMFNEYERRYNELNLAFKRVYLALKNKNENEIKEFVSDYVKLPEEHKKQVALNMLNQPDFQRNCCDILVKEYERNVKTDSTLAALDKALGLGKYFRNLVEKGIG